MLAFCLLCMKLICGIRFQTFDERGIEKNCKFAAFARFSSSCVTGLYPIKHLVSTHTASVEKLKNKEETTQTRPLFDYIKAGQARACSEPNRMFEKVLLCAVQVS